MTCNNTSVFHNDSHRKIDCSNYQNTFLFYKRRLCCLISDFCICTTLEIWGEVVSHNRTIQGSASPAKVVQQNSEKKDQGSYRRSRESLKTSGLHEIRALEFPTSPKRWCNLIKRQHGRDGFTIPSFITICLSFSFVVKEKKPDRSLHFFLLFSSSFFFLSCGWRRGARENNT